jgi:thiosulfate/3-mercaptopyruvate sulfurtransferase
MEDSGYTNPDLLWSISTLKDRLEDGSVRIVDTRPVYEYVVGHIPGAINLDVYGISLADTRPAPFVSFMTMYAYLLGSRGIGSDQTVVFYENNSGMRSARAFWVCEYHGHKDVHVLDGGLDAWQKAGNPTTQACEEVGTTVFSSDPKPDLNIGYEEILDSLGDESFVPLDTRSEGEHFGETVRAARGGAIPGAVHLEYVNSLDEHGYFKSGDELRTMYERAGIMPEQTVACY